MDWLLLQMVVLLAVIALAAGVWFGTRMEREYWIAHADIKTEWRTAICARRKFYYVIPEDEYVMMRAVNGPTVRGVRWDAPAGPPL